MDWVTQEFAVADQSALSVARRSQSLAELMPEFIAQLHSETQDAKTQVNAELTARGIPYNVQCDLVSDGVQLLHRSVPGVYVVQVRGSQVIAGKVTRFLETPRAEVTFKLAPSEDYSQLYAHSVGGLHMVASQAIKALLLPFFRAVIAAKY